MKTKKSRSIAIIISLLILFSNFAIINYGSAETLSLPKSGDIYHRSDEWGPFDRKDGVVQMWIDLADNYGGTYESIGKSSTGELNSEQWDIVLFKFGNPNGGKVMIDAHLHGNEYYGHEVLYNILVWVLTSDDNYANRILENNYLLIVPCVNYRFGRTNFNDPSWMSFNDWGGDGGDCGANLNRNFAPSWPSSLSNVNTDSYSGAYADSEPESQALINVWNIYQPSIYWNLHQGIGPSTSCTAVSSQAQANANEAKSLLSSIQSELGITSNAWSFNVGSSYGNGYSKDGAASRGIAGFLTEVMSEWSNAGDIHSRLSEGGDLYNNAKAMFIAMSQAVEVVSPQPTSTPLVTPEPTPLVTPEPTPLVTPEPTPLVTPEPTHSIKSDAVSFTGFVQYRSPVTQNFSVGINYMSSGNRWVDSDSQLDTDFSQFVQDGINHVSLRIFWTVMEPTYNPANIQLDQTALNNFKRVLDAADRNGLKVNVDFWTHFHDVNWDMPDYISSIFDLLDVDKAKYLRYVEAVVVELQDFDCIESWAVFNEPFYNTQSQKEPMEQLLIDTVNVVKSVDSRPVICRFALSFTPASGRFSESLYDYFDVFAVTEYLDPTDPDDTKGNGRWTYWDQLVADCGGRGLPLWVIEFGDDNVDEEHVRLHYLLSLEKFQVDGVVRAYSWAWQTRSASAEPYNIYNGQTPKLAYDELTKYQDNS